MTQKMILNITLKSFGLLIDKEQNPCGYLRRCAMMNYIITLSLEEI